MSLISALIPLNLSQEYKKFQADQTYNPQFIYSRDFTRKKLTLYGLPQEKYTLFAQNYLAKFATTSPRVQSGKLLTHSQISQQTRALFSQLHLDPPIIHWADIPSVAKRHNDGLVFAKNLPITQSGLDGILAHEVQTHLLRTHNQNLQILPKSKSSLYIRTEEGLASLNSKFVRHRVDFTYSSYRYLSCVWAQNESFAQVFAHFFQERHFNFDQSWHFALRSKRGLTDTSLPGGFTKDIVYLEGILQTLTWLLQPDNQVSDLYLGKISVEQVLEYKAHACRDGLILPTFLTNASDYQAYFEFLQACKQHVSGLGLF